MEDIHVLLGLGIVMAMVLVLPFTVRRVEEELEAFLLAMGALAVTMSGMWSGHLVMEALTEPIKITLAVLIFGILFRWARPAIQSHITQWCDRMGSRLFVFALVAGLGILSSVITAIMAALVLVEVISALSWSKDRERRIVVLACYSIGLGAVLTPIGEPLSTIATAKLAGEPHHADFFFLARLLWPWVTGGILVLSTLAVILAGKGDDHVAGGLVEDYVENNKTIIFRAFKVYVFIAALVLLGHGFTPFVDKYLLGLSRTTIYWVNTVSAVLDNATLAAAEISPKMSLARIEFLLMGLLVSGGMLIPGNIPNIICASKLGIKSGGWAKTALPIGIVLLIVYFVLMTLFIKGQ